MLSSALTAHAAKPRANTQRTWQLQGGVRYGLELTSHDYKLWQVGWGGAVGRTLKNSIYIGGSLDAYQGEQFHYIPADKRSPFVGGNYWQGQAQVGYDIGLSEHWLWRPKVGAGAARLNVNNCQTLVGNQADCRRTISYNGSLVPGVELIFARDVLVSLEARYALLFDTITIKHAVMGVANLGFQF